MIKHELAPDAPALWHEYSKLFPMIEGQARLDLQRDIRDNGLREPIVFLDGYVLDGRNRYICARELGMEYPRREFGSDPTDGDDPLKFVLSKNLHRRQLTPSQLANAAAKVATITASDFRGNQHTANELRANLPEAPTSAEAAGMFNVSERSVKTAKEVQANGIPELAEAVTQGDVSVSAAAVVARLPQEDQAELVEAGPDAIKAKAAELRNAPKEPPDEEADEDAFLAALDEAEREPDASETDNPDADIEQSAPIIDEAEPEEPDEPMSDEERQARKGLSVLTRIGLEDEIIGLRIENAELRAEKGQLKRTIEEQEDQISYLSADDQAQEVIKARQEVESAKQRASYWQDQHAQERRLHNAKAAVLKKLNKEIDGLRKRQADSGGMVDA